jgi:hypothetical protein
MCHFPISFGAFQAVLGPQGSEWEGSALLGINMGMCCCQQPSKQLLPPAGHVCQHRQGLTLTQSHEEPFALLSLASSSPLG